MSTQAVIGHRIHGQGGRTAIFLHGWSVSGAVWDSTVASLQGDGVRCVVPDQRGVHEDADDYSLESYGRDVIALADALDARTFTLVGHSMGGQIAQYVAAHHPDRVEGLVLLCPVPASGIPFPDEARTLFRTSGVNREAQPAIIDMSCKQLSAEARAAMIADAGKVRTSAIEGAFDTFTRGGFAERLAEIRARTLVVATDDPFIPPAFLRAEVVSKIARASLAYLPGPGHYVNTERPAACAALIDAFLAGSCP